MEINEYKKMASIENNHWWFLGKREYVKVVLDRFVKNRHLKILDAGCGTGGMSRFLKRYGMVTGLEKEDLALKLAGSKGTIVVKGSVNKMPFSPSSFDLVTFFDVLYHKDVDDRQALQQAFRILKKGGYLLITDCAYQWLWSKHDKIMHARERYVLKELKRKVEKVGFNVQKVSYIFTITFPIFLMIRFLSKLTNNTLNQEKNNQKINKIILVLIKSEAKLLRWFNLPFGSSILILAVK